MQRLTLTFLIIITAAIGAACGSDDSSAKQNSSNGVDLVSELTTIGNTVSLPTAGSETIQGKVVDTDEDGEADGLNLDNVANTAEVVYVSGSLGRQNVSLKAGTSFAFYFFDNPDSVFYFSLAENEDLVITDNSAGGNSVTIVVTDGAIAGLDTTGDGSADQVVLEGIVPVFFKGQDDPEELLSLPELPDSSKLFVVVKDADLPNTNKSDSGLAVELWAATTMYETSGYETEKVKLTQGDGGVWAGNLPIKDSGSRTIIIFDDAFSTPHVFGGSFFYNGTSSGSEGLDTAPTDDYFSPCQGLVINSGGEVSLSTLANFDAHPTDPGGITTPWLPVIPPGNIEGAPSDDKTNDEVFISISDKSNGDTIEVSYPSLNRGTFSDFCTCGVQGVLASATGSASTISGTLYFTDNNFGASGGSCPAARFPTGP
jgi:hypothetical protein